MAQRKVNKTEGHYLAGDAVTFDDELNFVTTANPEIDTQGSGGGFLWKTLTNIVNSWRLRDDVKNGGQDIIVIDTVNDTVELKSPYTAIGFRGEEFYLERIETINNSTGTPIEYFTEPQNGTEISNIISAIGGTYDMELSIVCKNTSTGGRVIINPEIGGSPIFIQPFTKESKDNSDIFYVGISKEVTLVAGNNTITLDLSNSGGGFGRIYEANITFTKV